MVGGEHLIEPLLDHRLTIGTRNADDGDIKLVTMALCQSLQGLEGRWDYEEVGIVIQVTSLRSHRYYEIAHTTPIEVTDIAMSVIAGGLQGKKQGFFRETK